MFGASFNLRQSVVVSGNRERERWCLLNTVLHKPTGCLDHAEQNQNIQRACDEYERLPDQRLRFTKPAFPSKTLMNGFFKVRQGWHKPELFHMSSDGADSYGKKTYVCGYIGRYNIEPLFLKKELLHLFRIPMTIYRKSCEPSVALYVLSRTRPTKCPNTLPLLPNKIFQPRMVQLLAKVCFGLLMSWVLTSFMRGY